MGNVNGAGNTLYADWSSYNIALTFSGTIAPTVTVSLQGSGNTFKLASGFALASSATLAVGTGATANITGLGVLPVGSGRRSAVSAALPAAPCR